MVKSIFTAGIKSFIVLYREDISYNFQLNFLSLFFQSNSRILYCLLTAIFWMLRKGKSSPPPGTIVFLPGIIKFGHKLDISAKG